MTAYNYYFIVFYCAFLFTWQHGELATLPFQCKKIKSISTGISAGSHVIMMSSWWLVSPRHRCHCSAPNLLQDLFSFKIWNSDALQTFQVLLVQLGKQARREIKLLCWWKSNRKTPSARQSALSLLLCSPGVITVKCLE